MSLFERIFSADPDRRGSFNYRVILDIGTEYVRTAVVEYSQEERNILAYASARQEYGSMDGGAITDIDAVVRKCKEALAAAGVHTPYKPTRMITGIAGEFVKGVLLTLEEEREDPEKRITEEELEMLHLRGRELAYQQVSEAVENESGDGDRLLEEITHSLAELRVDGCRVNNPLHFQGSHLKLTLFYTFAPLVQSGALRTVARELGLELEGIVTKPFALASSVMRTDSFKAGAVIIDIGGGTTDIVLFRMGGIEGSKMIASGGRDFTRTIATYYDISLKEAEELKLAYSRGEAAGRPGIEGLIGAELNQLYKAITRVLQELAGERTLPRKVYFCGGGSELKGLVGGLRDFWHTEKLPFAEQPELLNLSGGNLTLINDNTRELNGVEHTTTRSLSYYSTLLSGGERGLIGLEG